MNEEQRNAGLTTAVLAGVGERTTASGVSASGVATALATDEQAAPLFSPDEAKDFRARWDAIQVGFVDEPRRAVEQADSLVAGASSSISGPRSRRAGPNLGRQTSIAPGSGW